MNSKALSSVVAVVLITFLAVSAVGILYEVISPYLIEKTLSPAVSCFDLKVNPPFEIQNACFNNNTNQIELYLSQKNSMELGETMFSLNKEGASQTRWNCGNGCSTCLIDSETDKINLPAEGIVFENQNMTVEISGCFVASKELRLC